MNVLFAPVLMLLPLAAFWIWMFYDFVHNSDVPMHIRNLLLVCFLLAGIFAAAYYYFNFYRDRG